MSAPVVVRPMAREMPALEWFSVDGREYFCDASFDAAAYEAWLAEQIMLAAYGNLLFVSRSELQELQQKHENALIRRVFRRWAWKHVTKRGAPPRPR